MNFGDSSRCRSELLPPLWREVTHSVLAFGEASRKGTVCRVRHPRRNAMVGSATSYPDLRRAKLAMTPGVATSCSRGYHPGRRDSDGDRLRIY